MSSPLTSILSKARLKKTFLSFDDAVDWLCVRVSEQGSAFLQSDEYAVNKTAIDALKGEGKSTALISCSGDSYSLKLSESTRPIIFNNQDEAILFSKALGFSVNVVAGGFDCDAFIAKHEIKTREQLNSVVLDADSRTTVELAILERVANELRLSLSEIECQNNVIAQGLKDALGVTSNTDAIPLFSLLMTNKDNAADMKRVAGRLGNHVYKQALLDSDNINVYPRNLLALYRHGEATSNKTSSLLTSLKVMPSMLGVELSRSMDDCHAVLNIGLDGAPSEKYSILVFDNEKPLVFRSFNSENEMLDAVVSMGFEDVTDGAVYQKINLTDVFKRNAFAIHVFDKCRNGDISASEAIKLVYDFSKGVIDFNGNRIDEKAAQAEAAPVDGLLSTGNNKESAEPVSYVLGFGKHSGKSLSDVARDDIEYLVWLSGVDNLSRRVSANGITELADIVSKHRASQSVDNSEHKVQVDTATALSSKFTFGKYSGKTIGEVLKTDIGYLRWLSGQSFSPTFVGEVKTVLADFDSAETEKNKDFSLADAKAFLKARGVKVQYVQKVGGATDLRIIDAPQSIGKAKVFFAIKEAFDSSDIRNSGADKALVVTLGQVRSDEATRTVALALKGLYEAHDELMRQALSRKNEMLPYGEGAKLVGDETKALILGGSEFGIKENVLNNQIEDIGRMVSALENRKPMFILGNEAGTGKTFVLGGFIREVMARHSDVSASDFTFVTVNQDLIAQAKKDLVRFGVDGVNFVTYAALSEGKDVPYGRILIADEAHKLANIYSQRGDKGQSLMRRAEFSVISSATPFNNPAHAEYLKPTEFWRDGFSSFNDFATTFGAEEKKIGYTTVLEWSDNVDAAKKFNQWFLERGMLTQRAMELPAHQIETEFVPAKLGQDWLGLYEKIEKAYSHALESSDDDARIMQHRENTLKRVLEASKLDAVVAHTQGAILEGRYPVIYVESRSPRHLGRWKKLGSQDDGQLYDYPQVAEMMAEWSVLASQAAQIGDGVPPPPFASFIEQIAKEFYMAGVDVELPSTIDYIKNAIGEDEVAEYTGRVPLAKAAADLELWRDGRKRVFIGTFAKAEAGISLHDKVGNHQTTHINAVLPWTARALEQVLGRTARYGLKGVAKIVCLAALELPIENKLFHKVRRRLSDMGASVKGIDHSIAEKLETVFSDDFANGAVENGDVTLSPEAKFRIGELDENGLAVELGISNLELEARVKAITPLVGSYVKAKFPYFELSEQFREAVLLSRHKDSTETISDAVNQAVVRLENPVLALQNHSIAVNKTIVSKFGGKLSKAVEQTQKQYPNTYAHLLKESVLLVAFNIKNGRAQAEDAVYFGGFPAKEVQNEAEAGQSAIPAGDIAKAEESTGQMAIPDFEDAAEALEAESSGLNDDASEQSQDASSEANGKNKIADVGYVRGNAKEKWSKSLNVILQSEFSGNFSLSTHFPKPDYKELVDSGVCSKRGAAMLAVLRGKIADLIKHKTHTFLVADNFDLAKKLLINEQYVFDVIDSAGKIGIERASDEYTGVYVRSLLFFSNMLVEHLEPEYFDSAVSRFRVLGGRAKRDANGKLEWIGAFQQISPKKSFGWVDSFNDYDEKTRKLILSQITSEKAAGTKKQAKSISERLFAGTLRAGGAHVVGYSPTKGSPILIERMPDDIKNRKESEKWLQDNLERLVEKVEKMKLAVDFRRSDNTPRKGIDWREGRNISAVDLKNEFGLYAVQFGNSTLASQKEAQARTNDTFDAFCDICHILGLPRRAIGLGGKLSIAFGARGKGGGGMPTLAHYEAYEKIINLTRANGAGSLAHEWFHALDDYLYLLNGEQVDKNRHNIFASAIGGQGNASIEIKNSLKRLGITLRNNAFYEASFDLDRLFGKDYFALAHEMGARAFESYIYNRLADSASSNDFLVNLEDSVTGEDKESLFSIVPNKAALEVFGIGAAYDDLFSTLRVHFEKDEIKALNKIGSSFDIAAYEWLAASESEDALFRYKGLKEKASLIEMLEANGYRVTFDAAALRDFKAKDGDSSHAVLNELSSVWMVTREGKNHAFIMESDSEVFIDVSHYKSFEDMGSLLYQIVAAHAYHSGKVFIGDPEGLSDEAFFRRSEAMLSSALRFGATKHMQPHPRQERVLHGVPSSALEWGDDESRNIENLIRTCYHNVLFHIPEIGHLYYDFERPEFRVQSDFADAGGAAFRLAQYLNGRENSFIGLETILGRELPDLSRTLAGSATIKRAIVTQSLLQERNENERGFYLADSVGKLLSTSSELHPLRGLLYRSVDDWPVTGERKPVIEKWIAPVEEATGLSVKVVETVDELPLSVRQYAQAGTKGIYDWGRQQAWIVASRVRNQGEAVQIALHEGLGHCGAISFFEKNAEQGGTDMFALLDNLYHDIGQEALLAKVRGYDFDLDTAKGRRELTLEYIAHVAEENPDSLMVSDYSELSKKLNNNLFGEDVHWTADDVLELLHCSRLFVLFEQAELKGAGLDLTLSEREALRTKAFNEAFSHAGERLKWLLQEGRNPLVQAEAGGFIQRFSAIGLTGQLSDFYVTKSSQKDFGALPLDNLFDLSLSVFSQSDIVRQALFELGAYNPIAAHAYEDYQSLFAAAASHGDKNTLSRVMELKPNKAALVAYEIAAGSGAHCYARLVESNGRDNVNRELAKRGVYGVVCGTVLMPFDGLELADDVRQKLGFVDAGRNAFIDAVGNIPTVDFRVQTLKANPFIFNGQTMAIGNNLYSAMGFGLFFSSKLEMAEFYAHEAGGNIHAYDAHIPSDDELFSWDFPVSEQSEPVKNKLLSIGEAMRHRDWAFKFDAGQSGCTFYQKAIGVFGVERVTDFLLAGGIKGHYSNKDVICGNGETLFCVWDSAVYQYGSDADLSQQAQMRIAEYLSGGGSYIQALQKRGYHGTMADFDEFSLHSNGSGVGANSFGYGVYISESKGLAEQYRDVVNPAHAWLTKYAGDNYVYHAAAYELFGISTNDIIDALSVLGDKKPFLSMLNGKALANTVREQGRLYEVEVSDEARLLNYHKPLAWQDEALGALASGEETAGEFYERMSAEFGGGKNASQWFLSHGVDGFNYNLGNDANMVVWALDKISIVHKALNRSYEINKDVLAGLDAEIAESALKTNEGHPIVFYGRRGEALFSSDSRYFMDAETVEASIVNVKSLYRVDSVRAVSQVLSYPERIEELKAAGFDGVFYSSEENPLKGVSGWGNDYPALAVFDTAKVVFLDDVFKSEPLVLVGQGAGAVNVGNSDFVELMQRVSNKAAISDAAASLQRLPSVAQEVSNTLLRLDRVNANLNGVSANNALAVLSVDGSFNTIANMQSVVSAVSQAKLGDAANNQLYETLLNGDALVDAQAVTLGIKHIAEANACRLGDGVTGGQFFEQLSKKPYLLDDGLILAGGMDSAGALLARHGLSGIVSDGNICAFIEMPAEQFSASSVVVERYVLGIAQSMQRAGFEDAAIQNQTGWSQGQDGFWRYDLSDAKASLTGKAVDAIHLGAKGKTVLLTLGDTFECDALKHNYASLAGLPVLFGSDAARTVAKVVKNNGVNILSVSVPANASEQHTLSAIKHAIQAMVQRKEMPLASLEKSKESLIERWSNAMVRANEKHVTRSAKMLYSSADFMANQDYIIDAIGSPPDKTNLDKHGNWLRSAWGLIGAELDRQYRHAHGEDIKQAHAVSLVAAQSSSAGNEYHLNFSLLDDAQCVERIDFCSGVNALETDWAYSEAIKAMRNNGLRVNQDYHRAIDCLVSDGAITPAQGIRALVDAQVSLELKSGARVSSATKDFLKDIARIYPAENPEAVFWELKANNTAKLRESKPAHADAIESCEREDAYLKAVTILSGMAATDAVRFAIRADRRGDMPVSSAVDAILRTGMGIEGEKVARAIPVVYLGVDAERMPACIDAIKNTDFSSSGGLERLAELERVVFTILKDDNQLKYGTLDTAPVAASKSVTCDDAGLSI